MPDLFDYICNCPVRCYHLGMNAAGFVLVGGQSRRFGQDKALLPWQDGALVESVARVVRSVAGSVALIGAPERYRHLPLTVLEDSRTECGPLAGIEAALKLRTAEYNLICACDMPHLSAELLQCLINDAWKHQAQCTIVVDAAGRSHPLCAVYRLSCLPPVMDALDRNRFKLHDLIRELQVQVCLVENALSNVNTLDDWAAVGGRL